MDLLEALIVLALVATVAALAAGIASMVKGGEFDRRYSGQLMYTRVGAQGAALVLLIAALLVAAL